MMNRDLLTEASVVLVTGGGKGITAQCAIKLAKTTRCKLILVGRSKFIPSEPEWAAGIEEIEALQKEALAAYQKPGEKV